MAEKPVEKEKQLLDKAEISLILDTYDDIFSDFDPRPYSQRALSEDFLSEAKRRSKDNNPQVELRFMMPQSKRDLQTETMIKKRLKDHFKKHAQQLSNEFSQTIRKGVYFALSGVVIMFLAAFILFKYPATSLVTHFLVVLLEPAGWFLFWEGLNVAIFESKKSSPDLDFYNKMSKSEVSFISY